MRQKLDRLFRQLAVVRGGGAQIIVTRRVIKQQLRAAHPECLGIPQLHADLRANNQALRNLGRKAFATILRA